MTTVSQGGWLSPGDEMLAAALWWSGRGIAVFPCKPGEKRPDVPRGFKAATVYRNQILNWWEGRCGGSNIGMPTGLPYQYDVLDVDVRPDGDGWAAYRRLKDAGMLAGACRMIRTRSGGLHLYFAASGQRCGSLPKLHLDFKAAGGYVLLPPSQVDGRRYELLDDRPATGVTFDWEAAKALLCPPRRTAISRNQARSRPTGSIAHLPGWLADQDEGSRNNALFWAACRAAEAGDQAVLEKLADAAVLAGLDEAEVRRTIASAARRSNGE